MAVMTDILSININHNHITVGIVSEHLVCNNCHMQGVINTTHITVGFVSDSLVRNNCHIQGGIDEFLKSNHSGWY